MRDGVTVHCEKCGRFVSHVRGHASHESLQAVTGICSVHGEVEAVRYFMGDEYGWGWDDFNFEVE